MSTLLIISAASTFTTAGALGTWLIRTWRQRVRVRPVYVTCDGRRVVGSE